MVTVLFFPNDPYTALMEARARGLKLGEYIRAAKPNDHYHLVSVDLRGAEVIAADGVRKVSDDHDEAHDARIWLIEGLRGLNG